MALDLGPFEDTALLDRATAQAREAVGLPVGARVVAAMSGGVDSTVVAALLSRAGYEVVGVTLQLYDHGAPKPGGRSARAPAAPARTSATPAPPPSGWGSPTTCSTTRAASATP